MKHIRPALLLPGDIILTTSMSVFGTLTRMRTWPGQSKFNMRLGTHVALVCDRGSCLYYASEMQPSGGPEMGELTKYDRPADSWRSHICCVKRHPQLAESTYLRKMLNEYMIQMHSFKVRYGFRELFRTIWPGLPDDPYQQICSQWVVQALHHAKIPLPAEWLLRTGEPALVTPADIQKWNVLTEVTDALR